MGLSTHSAAKNLPSLQGNWLIGHGFWYVIGFGRHQEPKNRGVILGHLGTAKKGIRMVLEGWLLANEGYEDEIWLTMLCV